ncbi:hypothetical protein HCH_01588 [Hahella chejuensis KCTC 2396]|uniref:Uncharacterized protein n=1 Tax=Hahella chejuensis (strain KCTC 2396) TaxID=349521 RepID=Q2SLN0_HAHCH|nr:hypothetical protein [Hahella chejuensis]ABC28444.1 hypothetical protein HCH_01588 [Hahella chejuensis KCTC 2396]
MMLPRYLSVLLLLGALICLPGCGGGGEGGGGTSSSDDSNSGSVETGGEQGDTSDDTSNPSNPCDAPVGTQADLSEDCRTKDWEPVSSPDIFKAGPSGLLYVLSSEDTSKIYRWDLATQRYINPITLLNPISDFEYSASQERLLLGHENGEITAINITKDKTERPFAKLGLNIIKLVAADDDLWVVVPGDRDPYYSPDVLYLLDAVGQVKSSTSIDDHLYTLQWNSEAGRLYFFGHQTFPGTEYYACGSGDYVTKGSLYWRRYNKDTAIIEHSSELATCLEDGDFSLSPDGGELVDLRAQISDSDGDSALTKLRSPFTDPDALGFGEYKYNQTLWLEGHILATYIHEGKTYLIRWGDSRQVVDYRIYPGVAKALVDAGNQVALVVGDDGETSIYSYDIRLDDDGDGAPNREDAFPADISASKDSDNDGYPDEWNPGFTDADTTTGLSLDYYPYDSSCALIEHGAPMDVSLCDIARMHSEVVATIVQGNRQGDVFALNGDRNAIYRWSAVDHEYKNPWRLSQPVVDMSYSDSVKRLYVLYKNGEIRYFDEENENRFFAYMVGNPTTIIAGGDAVIVMASPVSEGAWLYDNNGRILAKGLITSAPPALNGWYASGKDDALYFFSHDFPELMISFSSSGYLDYIAQVDGPVSAGFLAYNPFKDLLLIDRAVYSFEEVGRQLTNAVSLPLSSLNGATWTKNSGLLTVSEKEGGGTLLTELNPAFEKIAEQEYEGAPIAVFGSEGDYMVVTKSDERIEINGYAPVVTD